MRPLFSRAIGGALAQARVRDGWQMLGRTYSQGHEPELEFALLERPVRNLLNPAYRVEQETPAGDVVLSTYRTGTGISFGLTYRLF